MGKFAIWLCDFTREPLFSEPWACLAWSCLIAVIDQMSGGCLFCNINISILSRHSISEFNKECEKCLQITLQISVLMSQRCIMPWIVESHWQVKYCFSTKSISIWWLGKPKVPLLHNLGINLNILHIKHCSFTGHGSPMSFKARFSLRSSFPFWWHWISRLPCGSGRVRPRFLLWQLFLFR